MREIKFRAKTRYAIGEQFWVYGLLVREVGGGWSIQTADFKHIGIDPKTIGQFTGCHNKYGAEIYEGDIVHLVRSLGYQSRKGDVGAIVPDECELGYSIDHNYPISKLTSPRSRHLEIIGTIHETPELLEDN